MNILEIFGICFIIILSLSLLLQIFLIIIGLYGSDKKQKEYKSLIKAEKELMEKERQEKEKMEESINNEELNERISKSLQE